MNPVAASRILAVVFALGGLFSIAAALGGWEWFFRNPNVRALTWRMSRFHSRIFYFILGVAIAAMGVYIFFTTLQ